MNRIILTSLMVVMLAVSGCTNATSPLQITRVYPLAGCALPKTDDGTQLAGSATVDVAAGAPQVLVGVELIGKSYSTPGLTLRTGETLEPKGANFPVFTDLVINYRLSRRLGSTPKTFNVAINATPGGTGESLQLNAPIALISPELGDQLTNGLSGSATLDDFVDIDVDIELRGEINSSRTPITSGVVTFPIRAVKSAPPACPTAGERYMRYPFVTDPVTMAPDLCRYVGSSFDGSGAPLETLNAYYLSGVPAPPTRCCNPTAGIPGC
ncbi:MAG: hypothetical protein QM817_03895 [Archangium sp.]